MANYMISYDKTMAREGIGAKGYANLPNDRGGETFMGISRVYHPGWEGWIYLDRLKKDNRFPNNINENTILFKSIVAGVRNFYRENYWNKIKGDDIPDQSLANSLFDYAVNSGISDAVIALQKALNFLNKRGSLYNNINADGIMGDGTLDVLKIYIESKKPVQYLLELIEADRIIHVRDYAEYDEKQEDYAYSWMDRIISQT